MTGNPNEIVTQAELKAEWESVLGTTSDIPADNECIKGQDVAGHSSEGVDVSFDNPTDPERYSELVRRVNIGVRKLTPDTTFSILYNGGGYPMPPRVKAILIQPELGTTIYPGLAISNEGFATTEMKVNPNEGIDMLTLTLLRVVGDNLDTSPFIDIQACNDGYGWDNLNTPYVSFGYRGYPDGYVTDLRINVPLFEGENNTIWIRVVTEDESNGPHPKKYS